jgi:hypothetical protein
MRKLLVVGVLALVVIAGCKKRVSKTEEDTSRDVVPGAGAAVQGVRLAVNRTVNQNEMENIRLFIETASSASGKMPSRAEVEQALQREAPKTWKMVQDKSITLTGVQSREGIWAYTTDPQTPAGEHLVVSGSGIERMNGQVMAQRLKMQ